MEHIYFQPPDINDKYCEVGIISESDPEYIWYLNEPCKVLITDVNIINKEDVIFDNKTKCYIIK